VRCSSTLARPWLRGSMVVANVAAIQKALRKRSPEEAEARKMRRESKLWEPAKYQWLADKLHQRDVRKAYQNPTVQWGIAFLIMGNFINNIIEKQMDPTGLVYEDTWKTCEFTWNTIFIFELIWNMWGTWYISTWKWGHQPHFLCSGWNLFDMLVVGVSIPTMTGADLGSFSQMRMLRAFRVFRLFKRIKSLNKIISSLFAAIPGLVNAAIVQLLVMCIYAILAVDLFKDFGEGGWYMNIQGQNVSLVTVREMDYGSEYYGNFFRSLYTLFQVLTGESWSEAVARPVIMAQDPGTHIIASLFYCSYMLICGIILVNVAVAVLLEKMVDVEAPADMDGIVLKELPDNVRMLMEPFDADGDGVITKEEITRAAMLLKREAAGGEHVDDEDAAATIASKLAEMTKNDIHCEMEQQRLEIEKMRLEQRERESKVQAALDAAAEREVLLQSSLQALSTTMEAMAAQAATRARRKPGTLNRMNTHAAANGGAVGNGSSVSVSNGVSNGILAGGGLGGSSGLGSGVLSDEDKLQDGERMATKQAPERAVQCV